MATTSDIEDMKPYFLPLNKEYYLKIKNGSQKSEIRPNNHRGWNMKNIYPGRVLNCSCGYGTQDRILKTITNTLLTRDLRQENVSLSHIEAVEAIFGKRDSWLIARLSPVGITGNRQSYRRCDTNEVK